MTGRWYEEKPGRLCTEVEAMQERFPGFWLVTTDEGRLAWQGVLKPAPRLQWGVEIVYPEAYPHDAPRARVIQPSLEPSPHQYGGGEICLMYLTEETRRDSRGQIAPTQTWIPSATAATLVPLVSVWLLVYDRHRRLCTARDGKPCTSNSCRVWAGPKHSLDGLVA